MATSTISEKDGMVHIDVKGQSCPNYLVSIQRAVQSLPPSTEARLFVTYGPGNGDVRVWCEARKIKILAMEESNGIWSIVIKTPAQN